ncbi:MAG: GH36 C-terminal domain-containing protein [Defluviitaleaceae bacterium]|nr:GH36 C-terminal domain-containing protein [Defluviitaleaceae bacterium]
MLAQKSYRLKTADTFIEVVPTNEGPVVTSLTNGAEGRNLIKHPRAVGLPHRIKTPDKERGSVAWTYTHTMSGRVGRGFSMFFSCSDDPRIYIVSEWHSLDGGKGPVQHRFIIHNGTGDSIIAGPLLSGIELETETEDMVVWRFNKDQAPVDEIGVYKDVPVNGAAYTASAFDGTAGGGFIPFLIVCGGGHGLYAGWEWQTGFAAAKVGDGSISISTGYDSGANDGVNGPDFFTDGCTVQARGAFAYPYSYIGAFTGDADNGSNAFTRWFWRNKTPASMHTDETEPWTQFGGMFYYFDPDKPDYTDENGEKKYYFWASDERTVLRALTDKSENSLRSIGFECFEIDYGWFGPDNAKPSFEASPVLFPGGMKKISDAAHENGFKFHLYFANLVNVDTTGQLAEKYSSYALDSWRSDFSRPDIPALKYLSRRIPNHRYETCNSGGRNKDFATYTFASVGTVTDIVYPLELRQAFYDSSYALPAAQLSQCQHIGYLSPGVKAALTESRDEFTYCLRSGMLGAFFPAVCACGPQYNPANIVLPSDEPLTVPIYKKNMQIYKEHLRPLIREGHIYHILPRPNGNDWDGIQYYIPAKDACAVMLFKPSAERGDSVRLKLRGLRPETNYRISFSDNPGQNLIMRGDELIHSGLEVFLPGKLVSEIILIHSLRK